MKGVAVTLVVLVTLFQLMAMPNAASVKVNCGQVSSALAPCVSYLTQGGTPSSTCCSGVKNLAGSLSSKADRIAACNCVKAAAARYPSIKPDAASNLPSKCGVKINFPISATTNCNK